MKGRVVFMAGGAGGIIFITHDIEEAVSLAGIRTVSAVALPRPRDDAIRALIRDEAYRAIAR